MAVLRGMDIECSLVCVSVVPNFSPHMNVSSADGLFAVKGLS